MKTLRECFNNCLSILFYFGYCSCNISARVFVTTNFSYTDFPESMRQLFLLVFVSVLPFNLIQFVFRFM